MKDPRHHNALWASFSYTVQCQLDFPSPNVSILRQVIQFLKCIFSPVIYCMPLFILCVLASPSMFCPMVACALRTFGRKNTAILHCTLGKETYMDCNYSVYCMNERCVISGDACCTNGLSLHQRRITKMLNNAKHLLFRPTGYLACFSNIGPHLLAKNLSCIKRKVVD